MAKNEIDRTVYATEAEALASPPPKVEAEPGKKVAGGAERKLFPVTCPDGTVVFTYGVNASDVIFNVATAAHYAYGTPYGAKKGGGVSKAAVVAGLSDEEIAALVAARGLSGKRLKALAASTTASNGAAAPSEGLNGAPAPEPEVAAEMVGS